MRRKLRHYLTLSLLIVLISSPGVADVDLKTIAELKLKASPVDISFSRDGMWLYVLLRSGALQIYSFKGELQGQIEVGSDFDEIEPGPLEDEIYLVNRKKNYIRVVEATISRKIDVSASPFKGAEDAPVVIVEYTDFECPYCATLSHTLSQLLKKYPKKIKIVYKSFPLKNHPYAWKAAANAMAAHQKGKFWEFHDELFTNHKSLNDEQIKKIRKSHGFDTPEFDALIKSSQVRTKVAQDRTEGQRLGVRGTPTVFVNGKRMKDKSIEGLRTAIDDELKKLEK